MARAAWSVLPESTRILGVRRPFHISLFLTAPRVVLPQYPSTVLIPITSKRKKTLKECYSCVPARASDCMNARAESTAIRIRAVVACRVLQITTEAPNAKSKPEKVQHVKENREIPVRPPPRGRPLAFYFTST